LVTAATADRLALRERLSERGERWGAILERLKTPCLLVDAETVDANCSVAAEHAWRMGLTIRPHAKAHKCSALLRRQLAAGSTKGITCATAEEAALLGRLGFDDVLVANEVVSAHGSALLEEAARLGTRLNVAVDSALGVDCAARAARAVGREIGVLIDFDVGSGRCGFCVETDDFVELARRVAMQPSLHLEGIMAYTGKANYFPKRVDRAAFAQVVKAQVQTARETLESGSFSLGVVSGGATGTFDLDQGLTEVQLGSYVLMEGRYATVGLPFAPALFCAATVISRARHNRVILDCGWKAMSGELGLPVMPPNLNPVSLSDEHLACDVALDSSFEVGQVVLTLPAHLDPTVNLHERVVVVEGGEASEWMIDLRRAGRRLLQ
jgi:D-serine deaminase-like pyridoxal phosphate-dependent protein